MGFELLITELHFQTPGPSPSLPLTTGILGDTEKRLNIYFESTYHLGFNSLSNNHVLDNLIATLNFVVRGLVFIICGSHNLGGS